MQTEAIFENIAERIYEEIDKAQKSVYIAVAWFTNKNLFNLLLRKARSGCKVFAIISDDTINSSIDFEQLSVNRSRVYRVGDGDTELMHNKFCVIDHNIVITGSYNWSYKAESNFENVVITYDDTTLAEQFVSEFFRIRNRYYPDEAKEEKVLPLNKVIKRLEILKNYILLEDVEELSREAYKLKEFVLNTELQKIIENISRQEYSEAILKIDIFLSKNQNLSIWLDSEIIALKLEIKILENQLNAYDNEKIELEKLLSEFQHLHSKKLGDILLEILMLRKLKYQSDSEKFSEAKNDEKQYREQFNAEKKIEIVELSEEQKSEIKIKFRKATILCHPDKVSDEFAEVAQRIFIDLKMAYDSNNLKKVSEILDDLEKGQYFKDRSDTIFEKDLLKVAIIKLKKQIKELEDYIITIKQNETYILVSSIVNWDMYFEETKENLLQELENLRLEVDSYIEP
jgi:hypothetical protein